MDIRNRHIVVIGAARSGVAVAELLQRNGAEVFVTDAGSVPEVFRNRLAKSGIPFEDGGHSERAETADFAVVSPGVPDEAPLVQHYLNAGKKVCSEIEAASWFAPNHVIAVTGSNGKTTTTSWMHHMWEAASRKSVLGGNIGTAWSEFADKTEKETDVILEVSSFQLDHIHTFRPAVSVILNITPDHLNRYQNRFENYTASKMSIMKNQKPEDVFIYNYDDPVLKEQIAGIGIRPEHPAMFSYSVNEAVERGAYIKNDEIVLKFNGKEEPLMPVSQVGLKGKHNLGNGLAAAISARVSEISNEAIRESLETFEGVEHRLELVRILNGVRWINDSKATNVNAVWFALQSVKVPTVLILGGRDKGNNYLELKDQLAEKVHTVIAIGEAQDKICDQLGDVVPYLIKADSMEDAVVTSFKKARKGEVVLLSPACASFDMFDSYEHRGEVYKNLVAKL